MGKSLYIHRMKELLASKTSVGPHEIIIPIHGPEVTTDTIVEALKGEFSNTRATIFHLDISPSVRNSMSSTVFYLCCSLLYHNLNLIRSSMYLSFYLACIPFSFHAHITTVVGVKAIKNSTATKAR